MGALNTRQELAELIGKNEADTGNSIRTGREVRPPCGNMGDREEARR